jgi:hypothetical protein
MDTRTERLLTTRADRAHARVARAERVAEAAREEFMHALHTAHRRRFYGHRYRATMASYSNALLALERADARAAKADALLTDPVLF